MDSTATPRRRFQVSSARGTSTTSAVAVWRSVEALCGVTAGCNATKLNHARVHPGSAAVAGICDRRCLLHSSSPRLTGRHHYQVEHCRFTTPSSGDECVPPRKRTVVGCGRTGIGAAGNTKYHQIQGFDDRMVGSERRVDVGRKINADSKCGWSSAVTDHCTRNWNGGVGCRANGINAGNGCVRQCGHHPRLKLYSSYEIPSHNGGVGHVQYDAGNSAATESDLIATETAYDDCRPVSAVLEGRQL